MRAKLSDKWWQTTRWAEIDSETEENAALAIDEALAILAETEPGTDGILPDATYQSCRYMSQQTLTHGTLISEGQAALIETLTAFCDS